MWTYHLIYLRESATNYHCTERTKISAIASHAVLRSLGQFLNKLRNESSGLPGHQIWTDLRTCPIIRFTVFGKSDKKLSWYTLCHCSPMLFLLSSQRIGIAVAIKPSSLEKSKTDSKTYEPFLLWKALLVEGCTMCSCRPQTVIRGLHEWMSF